VEPITQSYDTVVKAPADPTKEGYSFAGWSPEIPKRMEAKDQTIKATWERLAPQGILLTTATATGKRAIKITWTKLKNVDGYDIFYTKCGSYLQYMLGGTVEAGRKRSLTIKGLDKNEDYKCYIRAWIMQDGKKIYVGEKSPQAHIITSGYKETMTNPKSIVLNKKSATLKVGKTLKLKATVEGLYADMKILKHEGLVRYISSAPRIAKVNKKGVITALKAGACRIYALTSNGLYKSVKITVE